MTVEHLPSFIHVRRWEDPVIDALGFDPRSIYAETFWLPTVGPTTLLLLRHLARHFDAGNAVTLECAETAARLGVGARTGKHSPLRKSFGRLVRFGVAFAESEDSFAVKARLAPLTQRHLRHLPDRLVEMHRAFVERRVGSHEQARRIAVRLLDGGLDHDEIEDALRRYGVGAAEANAAVVWLRETVPATLSATAA